MKRKKNSFDLPVNIGFCGTRGIAYLIGLNKMIKQELVQPQ